MMAKAHMIAGATSWAIYSYFTPELADVNLQQTVGLMTVCAFSGLLPDIDHPTSTLGRNIYPVSKLISMVFGHRGFTHSLLALCGMIYLLISIDPYQEYGLLITCVSIGYLSHLVGDVITPAGLPLLYPIKHRFKTPFTIKAGGIGESILVTAYGLFAIALYTQWHQLIITQVNQWLT